MGNEAADGGQVWLVNCLNATLDANLQIRQAAEEALKQASLQAGPFPGLNLDPFFKINISDFGGGFFLNNSLLAY